MVGHKLSRVALVLAGVATVSCTPLPDTSPYTAATLQVRNSAAAAGGVVQAEFARMTPLLPQERQARAAQLGTRFDEAWRTTIASLDGLGRYAESLEEITKAGNSGAASARALADSVKNLAGAIGIVPGAAIAGVATDAFVMLNTQVQNIRGARALNRSLEVADPLIRDMSDVIVVQIRKARESFDEVIEVEQTALNFSVEDILQLDRRLEASEIETARTVASLTDRGGREAERVAAEARLKRIQDGRAALAPRMNTYRALRAAVAARAQAGHDIFDATERAVVNWRLAHQKVATAIRERRPVTVQSLIASAEEIRGLVERWRSL